MVHGKIQKIKDALGSNSTLKRKMCKRNKTKLHKIHSKAKLTWSGGDGRSSRYASHVKMFKEIS